MYRRIVSLLLLPSLLLSQAAVGGHAHGDETSVGHNLCPHIHTRSTDAHQHHHGHGGHHDDDEDAGPDAPLEPRADLGSDHDADAVYLPARELGVSRSSPVAKVAESVWWIAEQVFVGVVVSLRSPLTFRSHSPPPPDPVRPLYIQHLALLI